METLRISYSLNLEGHSIDTDINVEEEIAKGNKWDIEGVYPVLDVNDRHTGNADFDILVLEQIIEEV